MGKESNNFLEVMKLNDEDKIRQYLLQNGKKPKPISPFEFTKNDSVDEQKNSIDFKED